MGAALAAVLTLCCTDSTDSSTGHPSPHRCPGPTSQCSHGFCQLPQFTRNSLVWKLHHPLLFGQWLVGGQLRRSPLHLLLCLHGQHERGLPCSPFPLHRGMHSPQSCCPLLKLRSSMVRKLREHFQVAYSSAGHGSPCNHRRDSASTEP